IHGCAIAAPAIAQYQQFLDLGIVCPALLVPPRRDAVTGQFARVVAGVQVDEGFVLPHIVKTMGNHRSRSCAAEVVVVGLDGFLGVDLAVTVEIASNSFFFVSMLMTGRPAFKYCFLRRAIFLNWALRFGLRGPIVFFFRAFRLRYPFLRSNWETTCRLAGVPNLSSRREICPRDKFVHFTSARIGSPAVWSSSTLKKFASRAADISLSFLRPAPFFRTRLVSRSAVSSSSANPRRIVLGQRVVQALHHPFDSRCIGVHAALLPLVALQSKDLISYSLKIRKLFASRSLSKINRTTPRACSSGSSSSPPSDDLT